jgi:5-methylcytosine-specific restriction enzyme A
MNDELVKLLESLRPRQGNRIIDLVDQAGIDISNWSRTQDGSIVKTPAANPSFCYEWAFGGDTEPTLLCIWHSSISIIEDKIAVEDNLRQLAIELPRRAEKQNKEIRSRATKQATRARKFDSALISCFQKKQPVKVAILEGDSADEFELGFDSSSVRYRALDEALWYIHRYDMNTGAFRFVRGEFLKETNNSSLTEESRPTEFLDQFSIPDYPTKQDSTVTSYNRSPEVRRAVLLRAAGVCEYCGELGFKMGNGAIFLETHHVIPLAENGFDVEWNVVAICPNDHRRAHYAENKQEIRKLLIDSLSKYYPSQIDSLQKLADNIQGH